MISKTFACMWKEQNFNMHFLSLSLSLSNLQYRQYAHELDAGRFPEGMQEVLDEVGAMKQE